MATPTDDTSSPPSSATGSESVTRAKTSVGWHSTSQGLCGSNGCAVAVRNESCQHSNPSVQGVPQHAASGSSGLQPGILSQGDGQTLPAERSQSDASILPGEIIQAFSAQMAHLLQPPRPVLRRSSTYYTADDREETGLAEQITSQRKFKPITEAHHQEKSLAVSVGGYSGPVSGQDLVELDATFQSPLERSDEWLGHDDIRTPSLVTSHIRQLTPHSSQLQDIDRLDVAESLALSQNARANNFDFFHKHHKPTSSGTSTQSLEAQDYVPCSSKCHSGILSSLLKVDQNDRGQADSGAFESTTTTPAMSPQPSPPGSARPSTAGSSRSRPTSGSFSFHKSHSSTSSLSLTNLLKSSSMLAAPLTRRISDQWDTKINGRTAKSKKEQPRITVHIECVLARHRYLLQLCRALMMYGAPTHRLEEYMSKSARVLEIECQFLYLPSCMIVSFDDSATHTTEVKLVREPPGLDLGKLRDVHNIYKYVVHDKLGVEQATKQLDEVMAREAKFPTWFRVIMFGFASATVAPFAFEGRWIDMPFAFILGCIVGILQLVFAPSNQLFAHVFEVSAAIITSFLARGFGSINNGEVFCFSALAQSSIALILPGYIVLCASLEIQSHNLVAGSVRMVYAMIYTLFLGYGITIGATLYGMMDSNAASQTHCQAPLDRSWNLFFVPCFTLCLCIVNLAKWRQTPAMLIMSLAGYVVNSYTGLYFKGGGGQISNMLGALTVGILANLYSRLGRHADNFFLDVRDWWRKNVTRRYFSRRSNKSDIWTGTISDDESATAESIKNEKVESRRSVGYSLAAAAMLPAIFVQVPSGLAAGGSLLAGITSANEATGNKTISTSGASLGGVDSTAFNVLLMVVQVAISLSVGLFMSALIVYPLGKRRSGLFSF
ncbi:hypothetical protein NQ176_g3173 [Zarea fungicola]|uniref:Uncharacterized protein n=1 Tax=Zarea fungicola TaxID=93591 RepID=A0ACC1NL84_9HYPO|nr:hypothetical protein NQ176_g3173 [Lecanicillium fungicola]